MFDEIEIEGKKVKIFFDIDNMRLYMDQNWEDKIYEDNRKTEIIAINNNIICIDTCCNYMGAWNDTKYYKILYYFNFQTPAYTDGINKINRIKYFSNVVDDFLIPHIEPKEKLKEDKKTITLKLRNKELQININRKNYIEKYYENLEKKSFIECNFESTDDWKKIYDICGMVEEYLKISLYVKNIDKPIIKIYNLNDVEMGQLVINDCFYKNNKLFFGMGKYEGVIEKNTQKIFEFLCNNKVNLSNARDNELEYNVMFDTKKIYNLYSAFEIEGSRLYKKKDIDIIQENIKNKIIDFSKKIDEYGENKNFVDGLINDRIKDYGIGYGHKEKLKKAIEDYIDIIPERASFYGLKENAKEIVDTVYKLRTSIIHDNFIGDLGYEENRYLEYFEWIVYAMQLKRIGIDNEDIEEILNLTFGVG